jgi:hypothetical protein
MPGSSTLILIVVVIGVSTPLTVQADAEEASVILEGGPALFRGMTPVYTSATTTRPGGSGGVRVTYGLTDLFTADLAVATGIAEALEYEQQDTSDFGMGTLHHDLRAVRATAGATMRFGARWIPTASLAAGYQHRLLTGGAVIDEQRSQIGTFADQSASDILVVAGVGLDYRLGRHLIVGISAHAVHAFAIGGASFDALEIPIRVSYSWYPGWFRKQGMERLDD